MIIIIRALPKKKGQKKKKEKRKAKEKKEKKEEEKNKKNKKGNVTISFSTLVLQSSTLFFM